MLLLGSCSPPPPSETADAASDRVTELDAVCKSVAGAEPLVAIGQGQSDYLPLADLETVRVEPGPQGGHHIWVAVRMKNLLQSGTRTTLTAVAPETGTAIPPFEVIFTFDPAEDGFCKLYGLRFQLDRDGVDHRPLIGKELDVSATVTDRSGDSGTALARVVLSDAVR